MIASVLGFALAGYSAICLLVYIKQDALTYFPSPDIPVVPSDLGLEYESFELDLGASSVTGWIVHSQPEAPWVLQFHGNGGNISGRIGHLALFHRLGFNGVVFDYRGYGKSRGQPSEAGLLADATAVREHLLNKEQVDPSKLVYFGESLGGGVACALAEQQPPAGLLLKSTFTSVPDVAAEVYPFLPVRMLARTQFNSAQRIPKFNFPVMVAHGKADEVIPFHHGERLFEKATEPKRWMALAGTHNTGPLELGPEFIEAVGDFVRTSTSAPSGPTQAR